MSHGIGMSFCLYCFPEAHEESECETLFKQGLFNFKLIKLVIFVLFLGKMSRKKNYSL